MGAWKMEVRILGDGSLTAWVTGSLGDGRLGDRRREMGAWKMRAWEMGAY